MQVPVFPRLSANQRGGRRDTVEAVFNRLRSVSWRRSYSLGWDMYSSRSCIGQGHHHSNVSMFADMWSWADVGCGGGLQYLMSARGMLRCRLCLPEDSSDASTFRLNFNEQSIAFGISSGADMSMYREESKNSD